MKGYFDGDLHRNWFAILQGRGELPVLHGFDCFFIESHSKATSHSDMASAAVGFHNHEENAIALIARATRFRRVLGRR